MIVELHNEAPQLKYSNSANSSKNFHLILLSRGSKIARNSGTIQNKKETLNRVSIILQLCFSICI